jgi:hypothetical protein
MYRSSSQDLHRDYDDGLVSYHFHPEIAHRGVGYTNLQSVSTICSQHEQLRRIPQYSLQRRNRDAHGASAHAKVPILINVWDPTAEANLLLLFGMLQEPGHLI